MIKESSWDTGYLEGLECEWDFSFSKEDLNSFGELSRDKNPLHMDPDFAQRKGYEGPVVYGLLVASQISRLIGEELPDKNSILTGLTIDFFQPCYIDENLTFKAILSFKSDSTKALEFKYRISNQDKLLCKGKVNSIWRK